MLGHLRELDQFGLAATFKSSYQLHVWDEEAGGDLLFHHRDSMFVRKGSPSMTCSIWETYGFSVLGSSLMFTIRGSHPEQWHRAFPGRMPYLQTACWTGHWRVLVLTTRNHLAYTLARIWVFCPQFTNVLPKNAATRSSWRFSTPPCRRTLFRRLRAWYRAAGRRPSDPPVNTNPLNNASVLQCSAIFNCIIKLFRRYELYIMPIKKSLNTVVSLLLINLINTE